MEHLPLASVKSLVPCPPSPLQLWWQHLLPSCLPTASSGRTASGRVSFRVLAHGRGSGHGLSQQFSLNARKQVFASVSSSSNSETTSIGTPQFPLPPPKVSIGAPLLWIGVGVGLSALLSWGTTYLKQYAMKRAMTTMMEQMTSGNSNFKNSGFSPSSPYPFPSVPFPPPPASSPVATSRPVTTIDVSSVEVEATTTTEVRSDTDQTSERPRRIAFVDVSPEEISQKDPSTDVGIAEKDSSKEISDSSNEVLSNGSAFKQDQNSSTEQFEPRKAASVLSVDALEKMMEDPTVQKMVYPYLPEEMRNPTTFKWMLQNPQYRQQLQDMLNNMGGGSDWDNKMMDSLKSFDLSSPEVKQQFDQIGLTPEEVISKIMANPELALAFQNPKVQAAIMDCSQNPFSISKYQNDKEVMDVFNKISEIFPGVTGTP